MKQVLLAFHLHPKKHRHAKRVRVIFLAIGVFVELFTVMIWISFLGCDVQQEGNWKSILFVNTTLHR